MKKTIALCMIVKNEESHLERCLASAKSVVDEIIIVDTGSTDRTIEIAENYGAKVYHFDWINDFSAARNESIKYAGTDYILTLDADEYLTEDCDLQSDLVTNHDYYFVKVHNILSGERAINHLAIRLFVNHKGLEYRNRLHEHLNTMDKSKNLTSGHAQTTIMHVGYTDEMMEGRNKAKRNLPLMLQEVKEHPTAYNLFNMGRTYMWIGEHEKAIQYLKRAYSLSKGLIIVPELVATLCRSLGELNREEEALIILQDAVNVYPYEVDLLHLKALLFESIGYKKDAILAMESCLEIGDQGITVSEGNGTYIARFRLAQWYEDINQIERSYINIEEALRIKNDFSAGLHKYVEILNKAGVPEDDVYLSIKQLYPLSGIQRLKNVIEVFFGLRSSLLLRCLEEYEVNVEDPIKAVAFQYAGKFNEAAKVWLSISSIPEANGYDVTLLALLGRDQELLQRALSILNLNKNEKRFLLDLYQGNEVKPIKMTTELEQIIEFILMKLIDLKKYEEFENIFNKVWASSKKLKYSISDYLISKGFSQTVIDLMMQEYNHRPQDMKAIERIARSYEKQGNYNEAKNFYVQLIDKRSSYRDYENLYNLYERAGDKRNAKIIADYIKMTYPLCEWVNSGN